MLLLPRPHMSQRLALGTLECSFSPCTQIIVFMCNLNSNNLPRPLLLKKKKKKSPVYYRLEKKEGQPGSPGRVCYIMFFMQPGYGLPFFFFNMANV